MHHTPANFSKAISKRYKFCYYCNTASRGGIVLTIKNITILLQIVKQEVHREINFFGTAIRPKPFQYELYCKRSWQIFIGTIWSRCAMMGDALLHFYRERGPCTSYPALFSADNKNANL